MLYALIEKKKKNVNVVQPILNSSACFTFNPFLTRDPQTYFSNSAVPDEMPQNIVSVQGLHYLQII